MLRERYLHRLSVEKTKSRGIPCLEKGAVPALLILDMQDFFLDPESHAFIPSAPDIVPGLTGMARLFQSLGLPVIYTRHLNTSENAGLMAKRWKDLITRENPLSRISSAFDTSRSAVVEKTQYDAFYNTQLNELLEKFGATAVVITGVMTHLCCETTARSAFIRGYDVVFPVDCTASYNIELHRATMLNLFHGFADPVCGEDVMEAVRNAF